MICRKGGITDLLALALKSFGKRPTSLRRSLRMPGSGVHCHFAQKATPDLVNAVAAGAGDIDDGDIILSGFGAGAAVYDVRGRTGRRAMKRLRLQSGFTLETYEPSSPRAFRLDEPRLQSCREDERRSTVRRTCRPEYRLQDFGPFVEYALQGETLGEMIARSIAAQPLHSSELVMDLRVVGGRAIWRIRYCARSEPTVEHHAQRSLMQMLGAVGRYAGARRNQIEIHVAEPYAAEARAAAKPSRHRGSASRKGDYAISFPSSWLDDWTPIVGLPADLSIEELAPYRDRPLPENGGSGAGRARTA